MNPYDVVIGDPFLSTPPGKLQFNPLKVHKLGREALEIGLRAGRKWMASA